jgi:hypothetical protein
MSIPLDRLYHYIESIAQDIRKDNVVIYRFSPHGSKNIENLDLLRKYNWRELASLPCLYCNDQEPLNYDFYQTQKFPIGPQESIPSLLLKYQIPRQENFRHLINIYDRSILLHSEKRGENLELYANSQFIPVYYWSHAIIAQDWFRFANHIKQKKNVTKTFLIYNRAWSGTREYRLGFADRVIRLGLHENCLMRVSPVDPDLNKHYDLHQFEHPEWRPHNVIEKYFPISEAESHYSADFDLEDYESTDIEVVLETLFDDLRLHLTEKTLRPIATGQPFMLAGTYGSLKYLREYGFKTFNDCWDESYDMMSDSIERMNKITEVMGDIVSMAPAKHKKMLVQARAIAAYNKQHFFSNKFQKLIKQELTDNLSKAFKELETTNTSKIYLENRKKMLNVEEIKKIVTAKNYRPWYDHSYTRKIAAKVLKKARRYYLRSLSNN